MQNLACLLTPSGQSGKVFPQDRLMVGDSIGQHIVGIFNCIVQRVPATGVIRPRMNSGYNRVGII